MLQAEQCLLASVKTPEHSRGKKVAYTREVGFVPESVQSIKKEVNRYLVGTVMMYDYFMY